MRNHSTLLSYYICCKNSVYILHVIYATLLFYAILWFYVFVCPPGYEKIFCLFLNSILKWRIEGHKTEHQCHRLRLSKTISKEHQRNIVIIVSHSSRKQLVSFIFAVVIIIVVILVVFKLTSSLCVVIMRRCRRRNKNILMSYFRYFYDISLTAFVGGVCLYPVYLTAAWLIVILLLKPTPKETLRAKWKSGKQMRYAVYVVLEGFLK